MDIPKSKKTLHAFLVGEDAKISKEGVMKAGAILAGVALGAALNAQETQAYGGSSAIHSNNVDVVKGLDKSISGSEPGSTIARHSHHSSHASY